MFDLFPFSMSQTAGSMKFGPGSRLEGDSVDIRGGSSWMVISTRFVSGNIRGRWTSQKDQKATSLFFWSRTRVPWNYTSIDGCISRALSHWWMSREKCPLRQNSLTFDLLNLLYTWKELEKALKYPRHVVCWKGNRITGVEPQLHSLIRKHVNRA